MIKRILLTIVMLLLIAYLVAAVTVFNDKPAHQVCRDMELVIKDTLNAGFVTKNAGAAILQKKGIYPVGKKIITLIIKEPSCRRKQNVSHIGQLSPET